MFYFSNREDILDQEPDRFVRGNYLKYINGIDKIINYGEKEAKSVLVQIQETLIYTLVIIETVSFSILLLIIPIYYSGNISISIYKKINEKINKKFNKLDREF